MKIYANTFELRTPLERRYYAAPNSIFAFAVKATLDGEDADGTITVFQGSTELTPMEATIDGYKLYKRTSGSETAVNEFDIVYTKGAVIQHFTLIENITDSTVFDIDQEGGVFELPIASDSVLGGIKVGQNLTIEADGTLNAKAVPTKTSQLENDSGFITEADIPEVPVATTTTAGKVIVGSGLSVDANGKIDALTGEETDPVFNKWLSGSGIGAGNNATRDTYSVGIGYYADASATKSVAIGMQAKSGSYGIAIGNAAKANQQYTIQLGEGLNSNTNTFQVWNHTLLDKTTGKIPSERLLAATTTTAGAVIVGDGLSVDTDGKISVTGGGGGSETDPVFNNWLSGTNDVMIGKDTKHKTLNPNDNQSIILGLSASVGQINDNGNSNTIGIAIGRNASVKRKGIAIGDNAFANAYEQAIAIGRDSIADSGNYPTAIGCVAKATADHTIAVGVASLSQATGSIAIGRNTIASGERSIVIGYATENRTGRPGEFAIASAKNAIQLGTGINNEISSFQVYSYKVLDSDGNIPEARLSANALVKSTPTAVLSGTYSDGSEFSFDVYIKQ